MRSRDDNDVHVCVVGRKMEAKGIEFSIERVARADDDVMEARLRS